MATKIEVPFSKGDYETVNSVRFYQVLAKDEKTGDRTGLYMTKKFLAQLDADATDLIVTIAVGKADPGVKIDGKRPSAAKPEPKPEKEKETATAGAAKE